MEERKRKERSKVRHDGKERNREIKIERERGGREVKRVSEKYRVSGEKRDAHKRILLLLLQA